MTDKVKEISIWLLNPGIGIAREVLDENYKKHTDKDKQIHIMNKLTPHLII